MALISAHLNAGHSGGDSVAIGIYSLSLFPHLHTPFPPFFPSLISLLVSVDVKHHVYLNCRTTIVQKHELEQDKLVQAYPWTTSEDLIEEHPVLGNSQEGCTRTPDPGQLEKDSAETPDLRQLEEDILQKHPTFDSLKKTVQEHPASKTWGRSSYKNTPEQVEENNDLKTTEENNGAKTVPNNLRKIMGCCFFKSWTTRVRL